MANIIRKSFENKVTPKGKAYWVKVNSTVDEYEGKRKYSVSLKFNKEDEAKMKKFCDDTLAEAKASPDFKGKNWRHESDPRCGYNVQDDGSIEFRFQTGAFFTDKNTGEEKQKFVPIVNTQTKKKVPHDVKIGNESEMRISFTPMAYWMTKDSNGLNLYINKIAVDKLIEFGNNDDFSEFGVELVEDNPFDEDDLPI